jgi:hypothetical protein
MNREERKLEAVMNREKRKKEAIIRS